MDRRLHERTPKTWCTAETLQETNLKHGKPRLVRRQEHKERHLDTKPTFADTTTPKRSWCEKVSPYLSVLLVPKWIGDVLISDVTLRVHHAERLQLKLGLHTTKLIDVEQHIA